MSTRALVVLGGHLPHSRVVDHVAAHPPDVVICADSGFDHAVRLGLRPDVVVGDLDSIADPAAPGNLGIDVVRADPDKDHTDTELALAHALSLGAVEVTVAWGGGDRIDHVIGVFAALASPSLARLARLTVLVAADVVHVVHGAKQSTVEVETGATVSLVSLSGTATGVSTTGLRWPLLDEELHGWRARGVSNVAIEPTVVVSVATGVVAVVVNEETR